AAVGRRLLHLRPLSGGCVAEVYRADFADSTSAAVKIGSPDGASMLDREAFMLTYLADRSGGAFPVPRVLHADPALLVLEWIDARAPIDHAAQRHAAEVLAALHDIAPEDGRARFGLCRDTLIGPLSQPNPWTD